MNKRAKIMISIVTISIVIITIGYSVFFFYDRSHCYNKFISSIEDGNFSEVQKVIENKPNIINTKDGFGLSPLSHSIDKGKTYISILLIQNGADINERSEDLSWFFYKERPSSDCLGFNDFKYPYGGTPLHAAVFYDRKLVPYLIKKGADINSLTESKRTPIDYAAALGLYDTVKILIDAGADIKSKDRANPLFYASRFENRKVIELLVKHGADVNAIFDCTPLHIAVKNDCEQNVMALLEAGAKPDVKDNLGKTPLDYAKKNSKIYNILVNYNLKKNHNQNSH